MLFPTGSRALADQAASMERLVSTWSSGRCRLQWFVDEWDKTIVEFDTWRAFIGEVAAEFPDIME